MITRNCVSLLNFFKYSANLYTFTSSSAASISSSTQNGAGFIFSIANRSAIAVNAFSPPDRSIMFWSFLPVGCTCISIPHSSTFSSSSSLNSAFPPPNNSTNTSLKFLFICSNFSINCCFIVVVISAIIFLNFAAVFSKSKRCSHMKSYLSLVFLYSSIESTFMLPNSFIWLRSTFTSLAAFCTFCGLWYSPALFGVNSYSTHKLFTTCSKSCSSFVLRTSSFTSCPFKSSITLNCSLIFASAVFSFSPFACLSFFKFSTIFELFSTSDLIFAISFSNSCIFCSKLAFSSTTSLILFFLFSIDALLLSISCFILSTISSIDVPLSSKDDTDIFKFVISKFKSSIYFWLSLLLIANSSTTLLSFSISPFK